MEKKSQDENAPARPGEPQNAAPNSPLALAASEPAAAPAPQTSSKNPPPRRPRRKRPRKRVPLGVAMRRVGLDERAIAENYAGVVEKLTTGQQTTNAGAEKLLVDVLKECTRVLDPPPRPGASAGGDVPVVVHLNHNVPRPARGPAPAADPPPAAAAVRNPASTAAMDAFTAGAAEEGERRGTELS
jgi:hypothetical protein